MCKWLRSAITNSHTQEQSAKSVAMLFTLLVLSVLAAALVVLDVVGVAVSQEVATVLTSVVGAMAAVAGGSYTVGKVTGAWSARRSMRQPDQDDNLGDA